MKFKLQKSKLTISICYTAIEVASGDYGEEWISRLTKATALMSDSESSGLANDLSDGEDECRSRSSGSASPSHRGKDKRAAKDSDVVVALMGTEMGDVESSETVVSEDGRFRKFNNQFLVLLRRSFLCIYRDLVSLLIQ